MKRERREQKPKRMKHFLYRKERQGVIWIFATMIIGILAIGLMLIVLNTTWSAMTLWRLEFGSGYSSNTITFLEQMWPALPFIIILGMIIWAWQQSQRKSEVM